MDDRAAGSRPVIVPMPAEIDLANADRVGEELRIAASPGVTIIVADLTATQFCDSAGIPHAAARPGQRRGQPGPVAAGGGA
jgi:anti-anti-sigma regulatory factor